MNWYSMSDKAQKVFIFSEKESRRILMVKKSQGLDFTLLSTQWNCSELILDQAPSVTAVLSQTWTSERGLIEAGAPAAAELPALQLLQKKLEILISMKANLHVMWDQAKQDVSDDMVSRLSIRPENFPKVWKLLETERRQLRERTKRFFEAFQQQIELAQTPQELAERYQHTILNVTLGGYAVFSRDIQR